MMMMKLADVLDDEIDSAQSGFAINQEIERQTEILKRYIADQMAHLRRWTFGIAVGAAAISVAIIGVLIAVT